MIASTRTLHVDRDAPAARDCARSLEEAVACLTSAHYATVVLHTRAPQRDDYGLVDYLSATWPEFFHSLTVRIEGREAPA